MNDIYHKRYVLEFDVWDPMKKITESELDALMSDVKTKKLLHHAGNVKITPVSEDRIIGPEAA
jgi:hypothetical protein